VEDGLVRKAWRLQLLVTDGSGAEILGGGGVGWDAGEVVRQLGL
jgi:hypothetical protein